MELSMSPFSLKPSAFLHQRCKSSSYCNRLACFKPITQNIKYSSNFPSKQSTNRLILPLGLHGKSKQDGCNIIQASAQAGRNDSDSTVLTKVLRFGIASFKFTRPYTMYHVIASTICLFARVLVENPQLFTWSLLPKAFSGLIAILLVNAYCTGINQIYDVDIDRVNKPYLSIPSGELSLKQVWFLVIFAALSGLLILRLMNADLITTSLYCLGLLMSTFYSAPPIRYKRSSVVTSILNSLVGGILHNVGILYATRASLGLPFQWSPPIVFITTFSGLLFLVINNIKDLTDMEGDIKHNIRTFPTIYGPRKVAFFFTGILLVNYIGSMVIAICMPQAFKAYIMAPAHTIFSLWLLTEAKKLDKANYTKALKFYIRPSAHAIVSLWLLIEADKANYNKAFKSYIMPSAHAIFSLWLLIEADKANYNKVCAQVESGDSHSTLTKVLRFGSACCKFARVYGIIPLIISTICLFARVFLQNPPLFQVSLLFKAFPGLIAVVFANAYHNGINGIFDADIDRINKPYLPIPSGEISHKQAWFLMIFYIVVGLLILSWMNANLITTSIYGLGLLLATMYSVPPFRLKRYSLVTSLVNSAVRSSNEKFKIRYFTASGTVLEDVNYIKKLVEQVELF